MGFYFAHLVGLIAFAQYTISFPPAESQLTTEPIFACPHLDLMSLIRQKQTSESCDFCHTSASQTCQSTENTNLVVFNVIRILGGSK